MVVQEACQLVCAVPQLLRCTGLADVPQGVGHQQGHVAQGAAHKLALIHAPMLGQKHPSLQGCRRLHWLCPPDIPNIKKPVRQQCCPRTLVVSAHTPYAQIKSQPAVKKTEEMVWPYVSPYADPVMEKVGSSSYYQAAVNHLKPIAANGI